MESISKHAQSTSTTQTASGAGFDLKALRLTQDYTAQVGVKKLITTVPVRKPHRQEFVRVHPDEAYRMAAAIIERKDENESYIVVPTLLPELTSEYAPKILLTAINRQGVVFLWPIRLPQEDGRIDDYNRSALDAATGHATKQWVRIGANKSLGAYEVFTAAGELSEPQWPATTFDELVKIAFRGRIIDTMTHPILKSLRGEI